MDAALQAVYAPRDPIGEFWRGEITLRQLRVLVEGLPPDNAVVRARNEGRESWHDRDWMLHEIESRLRDLQATVANFGGANLTQDDIKYLPTPNDAEESEPVMSEQQINEMDALMERLGGF